MKTLFKKRLPYPVSGISWLLVLIQFSLLGYLSISAPLLASHLYALLLELGGILVAIAGLIRLNWISFSVFPEPRPDGRLETRGIYAILRHPMYAGLMLVAIVLTTEFPSALRITGTLLLCSVFIVKIKKEELLLEKKYPEFQAWKKTSNRLIPFVW